MERNIRIRSVLVMVIIFALIACKETVEPFTPPDQFTETEKHLMGLWIYQFIEVKDQLPTFNKASFVMEPNVESSKRADLDNRLLYFSKEKTYQLRWRDRGYYELGTIGDPNWQPSFGYWELNAAEDSLIFNKGQFYETRYAITMGDGLMDRSSKRHMSSTFTNPNLPSWSAGDTILYKEFFRKVGN